MQIEITISQHHPQPTTPYFPTHFLNNHSGHQSPLYKACLWRAGSSMPKKIKDRMYEWAVLLIIGLRISALLRFPTGFTHKPASSSPVPLRPVETLPDFSDTTAKLSTQSINAHPPTTDAYTGTPTHPFPTPTIPHPACPLSSRPVYARCLWPPTHLTFPLPPTNPLPPFTPSQTTPPTLSHWAVYHALLDGAILFPAPGPGTGPKTGITNKDVNIAKTLKQWLNMNNGITFYTHANFKSKFIYSPFLLIG